MANNVIERFFKNKDFFLMNHLAFTKKNKNIKKSFLLVFSVL